MGEASVTHDEDVPCLAGARPSSARGAARFRDEMGHKRVINTSLSLGSGNQRLAPRRALGNDHDLVAGRKL